jgi:hypothetical protein
MEPALAAQAISDRNTTRPVPESKVRDRVLAQVLRSMQLLLKSKSSAAISEFR